MIEVTVGDSAVGQSVVIRGGLDVGAVSDLRVRMHTIVDSGTGVLLLDLADCVVRDSTGFGLLVETMRRCHRRGRTLRIVAADARTRRLLYMVRLDWLLACGADCARPHAHQHAGPSIVAVG